MAYILQRSDPLPEELRRVALEQMDTALAAVEDTTRQAASRVHVVRRSCKRLRGLLRLVEPALKSRFGREDKLIRKAARQLASHRDARVLLDTHLDIVAGITVDNHSGLDCLTDALQQSVEAVEDGPSLNAGLSEAAANLEIVWQRSAGWDPKGNVDKILSRGYALTYRRAFDGQQEAYTKHDARSFHRWRAQVKYHYYHLRLLANAWPTALGARAEVAAELADSLGRANDLTVYSDYLISSEGAPDVVNALIDRVLKSRNQLWEQAQRSGTLLFHLSEKAMRKDMQHLWHLYLRCES